MRQSLRALEDGSFVERATAPVPGAVIGMQFHHDVLEDAAFRHTRRCFRSIISDLVTFMDQVLAAKRLIDQGLKVPPEGLRDAKAVLAFVQAALDDHFILSWRMPRCAALTR